MASSLSVHEPERPVDGQRTGAPGQPGVIGRFTELDAIDVFLTGPAAGTLVLEGEAGIGKSTLWAAGIEMARARGHCVLDARPAAVESSLTLASLRDLLSDAPREARRLLPDVQQHALAVALAEEEAGSTAVERGVLGVAVLELLRALATERPVLLAIDDLQWLDESSGTVLVYLLRRLGESDVRALVSCRDEHGRPLPFALERSLDERSLTRLALGPMSEGAIRRLLRLRLGLSLTRTELRALYAATGGNPLFALELSRVGLDVDEMGSLRVPSNLHELVGARLQTLPSSTRHALLLVAALADPREEVLERAGVGEVLTPALNAGVLQPADGRIRFTHPLVGAAAWSDATEQRRREAHRALADAVDDLEERAHHLAATAEPPDPVVAGVLEAAATAARSRGAPAAAADLLDRALELTPPDELESWARLAASAAVAHADAGHWDAVWDLVEQAQERVPPSPERAAILVTATQMRPGLEELLHQAIAEAGVTPVGVQARIGLAAQATFAGRWDESVEAARDATQLARSLREPALLGVALTYFGGLKLLASRPDWTREIAEALAIEQELGGLPASVFQSPRMYQGVALVCSGDPDSARPLFEERLALASERGDDLSAFQSMLLLLHAELRAGSWDSARTRGRAAVDLVEAIGYEYERPILFGSLALLEACEGDLDRARALGAEAASTLTALGDRFWSTYALASLVFTELCAGNAAEALVHADAIAERFPDGRECWWSYHQGDEIEALVLAGEFERALARVEALRTAGDDVPLSRFLAWAARGDGLVHAARGDLAAARAALEEALFQHERFTLPFDRARTLLAYGHVLRRQNRRRVARVALDEALAEFERLGARQYVATTRAELKHVGGRPPAGEHKLTGAEDRIARLVATGLSNKEAAEQLFVAVSTVEATLTRVYRKLGVSSRSQLARVLSERDSDS